MLCRLDSLKDCCQHVPCAASPRWWVLVGAVLPPVPHTNLKSSGPVVFIAGAGGEPPCEGDKQPHQATSGTRQGVSRAGMSSIQGVAMIPVQKDRQTDV